MIYAFTGKKNSGKNTAASMVNYIVNGFSYEDWYSRYFPIAKKEDCIWFKEKSFASKVKDVCSILTGISREDWDKKELRDVELVIEGLETPWIINGRPESGALEEQLLDNYTYRTFMQRVGTEAMRDCIHQDIWVNALMQDYKAVNYLQCIASEGFVSPIMPNWVITDLRFDNEAKAVKERGGKIFQIDRTDSMDKDTHASEQPINYNYVDYFIGNNGTLEELFNKLELVIK